MKNHNIDIYRNLSILYANGIYISDILYFMGIETVYVYGAGEMGKLLLSDLLGRMRVPAVFDRDRKKQGIKRVWTRSKRKDSGQKIWHEYQVFPIEEIPNDEVYFIITPSNNYYSISKDLIKKGKLRSQLLSLNLILHYGIYFLSEICSDHVINYQNTITKEFLITGAQFNNKGAQNMSYITISEIRKRYEDAVIWYIPNYGEEYRNYWDEYRVIFLLDGTDIDSTLYEVIPRLSGLIDISGTAWAIKDGLGKKLNCFRMAYEYKIPIYFMPQSFDSPAFDTEVEDELKKILSYASIIYAREEKGYKYLKDNLELNNVKKSEDIVLQNKNLCKEYIFTNEQKDVDFKLPTKNNVAIIPNIQNYKHGNPKFVDQLYKNAIRTLLLLKKNVYIIPYAEDEEVCKSIYSDFLNEDSVFFYEVQFNCIEYRDLVRNFEYIVGSRFHAIVNAYKEYIPCIIIGWLEKYEELSEKFGQASYLFDVRTQIEMANVEYVIRKMNHFWKEEAKKIEANLPKLQKEDCFDVLNNL